jgi:hypothetical protein
MGDRSTVHRCGLGTIGCWCRCQPTGSLCSVLAVPTGCGTPAGAAIIQASPGELRHALGRLLSQYSLRCAIPTAHVSRCDSILGQRARPSILRQDGSKIVPWPWRYSAEGSGCPSWCSFACGLRGGSDRSNQAILRFRLGGVPRPRGSQGWAELHRACFLAVRDSSHAFIMRSSSELHQTLRSAVFWCAPSHPILALCQVPLASSLPCL